MREKGNVMKTWMVAGWIVLFTSQAYAGSRCAEIPGEPTGKPKPWARIGKVVGIDAEAHVPRCHILWIDGSEVEPMNCEFEYQSLVPGDFVTATVNYREDWMANGCLRYRSYQTLIGKIEPFPN